MNATHNAENLLLCDKSTQRHMELKNVFRSILQTLQSKDWTHQPSTNIQKNRRHRRPK